MTVRRISPIGTDEGDGTVEPINTFEYAQEIMQEGDTLIVEDGYYVLSEVYNPPKGTTTEAAEGAHPIISGLNISVGEEVWTKDGEDFVADWQDHWTVGIPTSDKGEQRIDRNDFAAYREMIVVDDDPFPYRQVLTPDLNPGDFYIEADLYHRSPTSIRIRFREGDEPKVVFMSTLNGLININPRNGNALTPNLTFRGLILEYAANSYATGLVQLGPGTGNNSVVRNCEVRWSGSDGIRVGGSNNLIQGNHVHHNGRGDLTGWWTRDSLFEYNHTHDSNWGGFNPGYGCGNKFAQAHRNIFRYNFFGPTPHLHDGIWLDVDCDENLIYANKIENVARAGIFIEISDRNYVCHNVIDGVREFKPGSTRAGINIAESTNTFVAHNTVLNCARGIHLKAGGNRHEMHSNVVINNLVFDCDYEDVVRIETHPEYTEEQIKSNIFEGNAYGSRGGNFFFHQAYGIVRNDRLPLTQLNEWREKTGLDSTSFILDMDVPFVEENGFDPVVESSILGRSVPIPSGWWDEFHVNEDYYRLPRELQTVGAVDKPYPTVNIGELITENEALKAENKLLKSELETFSAKLDKVVGALIKLREVINMLDEIG